MELFQCRIIDVAAGTGDMSKKLYDFQIKNSLNPSNIKEELEMGIYIIIH